MTNDGKIDLSALQDGKLHLIAFCGTRFVYLVADPGGSPFLFEETVTVKFPLAIQKMLSDDALKLTEPFLENG